MLSMAEMLKHTSQTKRWLTSMVLASAGWDLKQVNPEVMSGPMTTLYIWDRPSKWGWLCQVRTEDFERLATFAQRRPAVWREIQGGLGALMREAVQGGPFSDSVEGLDWEAQLAILLCAYAGTTRTWEAMKAQPTPSTHFIVLSYRPSTDSATTNLRPFAVPGGDAAKGAPAVLPVEEFQHAIQTVMNRDLLLYPEWFLPT